MLMYVDVSFQGGTPRLKDSGWRESVTQRSGTPDLLELPYSPFRSKKTSEVGDRSFIQPTIGIFRLGMSDFRDTDLHKNP